MAFSALFSHIVPLYSWILFGWLYARTIGIELRSIANLLFYGIGPVFVFLSLATRPWDAGALILPATTFILCVVVGTLTFVAMSGVGSRRRAIAAFANGSGNSGYFGIPVLAAIYGESILPVAVLCSLGYSLYENTLGYYFASRGRHGISESLRRVTRLPMLYATLLGLGIQYLGIGTAFSFTSLLPTARSAYTCLGMSLLGMACASFRISLDAAKFVSALVALRLVLWPAAYAFANSMGRFGISFEESTLNVFTVFSVAPLPIMSVAVASVLELGSEDIALAVISTSLLSLFTIPAVVAFL